MHNPRLVSALLALSVTSSSCLFKRSPGAFTPPPPQTRARRTTVAENLPPPPQIATDPEVAPPAISTTMPDTIEPPKPPAPPPVKKQPPPRATPPAPQPEPPSPPKIGQIFSADDLRALNREIDDRLDRVKKALTVVAGKNLNGDQSETANRIRTFQKQAEQAREQDPLTAVSLAKRADLLAQDLLQHLP